MSASLDVRSRLGEFDIIARHFAPLAAAAPAALALRDDAALVDPGRDRSVVVTTDALVAGVHFPLDAQPEQVAAKSLGVNLSDLAAMGAEPLAYLLAIALPKAWSPAELDQWLGRFASRLAADQQAYGVVLIGGDTVATPGPLTLTVTAMGTVVPNKALLRSGARVGDGVFVSGTIGDAALGLAVAAGAYRDLEPEERVFLLERLHLPRPRLALGQRLAGIASAAADISDGLIADLDHVCAASGVAAVIDLARVPLSPAGAAAIGNDVARLTSAVSGGDDYELVFTAAVSAQPALDAIASAISLPLTQIGRVLPASHGRERVRASFQGREIDFGESGWQHFR